MKIFIFTFVSLIELQANAYIGPGMGIGAIISILGAVGAILLAIFGIVYYPLKRFIRRRKK